VLILCRGLHAHESQHLIVIMTSTVEKSRCSVANLGLHASKSGLRAETWLDDDCLHAAYVQCVSAVQRASVPSVKPATAVAFTHSSACRTHASVAGTKSRHTPVTNAGPRNTMKTA
jgi:hypothetical protein